MRTVLKGKWFILGIWIAAVVVLALLAPNMENLVREKGQVSVPKGYSSSYAKTLLDELSKKGNSDNDNQVALVFHSKNKLTDGQLDDIKAGIDKLENNKDQLGITDVRTHFKNKELKSQLVSKDGNTVLASVAVKKKGREPAQISKALYKELESVKVDHYYTSNWMINEDVVASSQEGLKKTEYITIIFILAVLFIVFRSFTAPLVPLITVGISYVAAQSIVAFLVDRFNFPLSTFTQIFLVAVLFGIGTDYCILLLSRYKEEINNHETLSEAIITTYKTAGRTVFYSGVAVMIGFAAIGFSTFKLYQSAAAVAIGVAVLLLALLTIVPVFMALLGNKLFWPSKASAEHKQSRLWGLAGSFSFKRPIISLLLVAVIVTPFLAFYKGTLSFNSLDEIGDKYNSVKAFNVISDNFGPGESLPATVVLKNDIAMDTPAYLATIEKLSREIEKVPGVDKVRSATRPAGKELKQLQVAHQVGKVSDGLDKGNKGLNKISGGLQQASGKLSESSPQLKKTQKGIGGLVDGTNGIKNGVGKLSGGLGKIENGIRSGSQGAGDLKEAVDQAQSAANQLYKGNLQLANSLKKLKPGLVKLHSGYEKINEGLQKSTGGLSNLTSQNAFGKLEKSHPELQGDRNYLTIKGTVTQVQQGLTKLSGALTQVNGQFQSQVIDQLDLKNVDQLSNGQQKLAAGLGKISQGLGQLQTGLSKAANGQSQVVSKLPEVQGGLEKIANGQEKLKDGFSQMDGQLSQLSNGLNKSAKGIKKVSGGIDSAGNYLNDISKASDKQMTGFYLPEKVINNKDFRKVFDNYMPADRKITTLDVVFKKNPYSAAAIDKVDEIKGAIKRSVRDTNLENVNYAVSGVTSMNSDLSEMSAKDYSRTVVLMLVGISIILIIMLRSFIMPLYIIGSLILTYYTAMAFSEMIFVRILGYSGINWAVPFFAFVILVALGVDYSIFLMDRFNEYKTLTVREAMTLAMKNMGTVIISAVVILGGTFAAMLPAGVLSLLQIATIILSGLLLYAFVVLPLFVPVMVRTFGKANWWPFMDKKQHEE
ncbi:MmpL domain-containing protein [Fictibacillus macauensis ZFHKF-1]|uniref:MmpL domain-containing protein n=1 Tax=Fictibacillus macauensis ZFHKF-1 TaxID=1196324 RepID=I8UKP3_9BACL|nr:MMPL family transporter [Fictibacillus macauensis]EIT87398.1 MmpL domain-containing protein [Fictibacillus macauensis ZFHKF-1]